MNFFTDPMNLLLACAAAVSGGLLAWPLVAGRSSASGLGSLEVTQLINGKNAIVLDVREPAEFAAGSITGARNIPADAITARIGELSKFKNRPVIVVCDRGQRSAKVVAQLKKEGFSQVHSLAGGIARWRDTGLPVVVPSGKSAAKGGGKAPAIPRAAERAVQEQA